MHCISLLDIGFLESIIKELKPHKNVSIDGTFLTFKGQTMHMTGDILYRLWFYISLLQFHIYNNTYICCKQIYTEYISLRALTQ